VTAIAAGAATGPCRSNTSLIVFAAPAATPAASSRSAGSLMFPSKGAPGAKLTTTTSSSPGRLAS
jgi:hypothetical protein